MTYKGLEQQINELWASRGLEVIEETCEPVYPSVLGKNKFKWTVIAKRNEKLEKKAAEKAKQKFMTLRRLLRLNRAGTYSDSELLHFLAGWCHFAPRGEEEKLLQSLEGI